MTEDPRKTGLKNGLRQLNLEQLRRLIYYPGEMVLDTYNYQDGKFCPLAVAVGLDETLENPTHDTVFLKLSEMGYKVYNTRGIQGNFYTTDRKQDLFTAAYEVFSEKIKNIQEGKDPCTCKCGVCSKDYHIFCNKFMHGNVKEAERWFIEHPEAARDVQPLSDAGKKVLESALKKIEKKG